MISLSPLKLLIVLVVALVLLGPDKLPQVARQVGAGWSAFRKLRERLEEEVRESVPDLPSAHEIVRVVRSPVSFLDSLADQHGDSTEARAGPVGAADEVGDDEAASDTTFDDTGGHPRGGDDVSATPPSVVDIPVVSAPAGHRLRVPDDPSMN